MAERVVLTRAAQQRLEKLQEQYKPKRASVPPPPIAIEIGQVAVTLCRDELAHAKKAFDTFQWSDSAKLYSDVLRHAEALRIANPSQPEIDTVVASATLGEAASLLNLQQTEKAAQLLMDINTASLSERQRCTLATALVQIDQPARAHELLASVSPEGQEQDFFIEARQIVDLVGNGAPPSTPARAASVLNVLAQHYLTTNLVAKAADTANEGLVIADKSPILRASLLASVMISLLRTLFEDDLADEGVPIVSRRRYAELIVTAFPEVFRTDLPNLTRQMLLGVGLNYASSVRERRLLRWILENTDDALRDQAVSPEGARAFTLAGEGRINDAIAALPRQAHPWRSELQRCQLIAFAGDGNRAIDELLSLSTRWPNRFPIHAALAEALSEVNRPREAADHAEAALGLFPTDSMAELFARCLVNSAQGERALAILNDYPTNEHVAELRAYAAELAHDATAASHWQELLRLRPENRAANLGLALALARSGDAEGAARHARDLVNREIDRLSRDELAACGQILSLARFLPGTDDLIRRIADTLRTRFPHDDTAEFQRLSLVTTLGFPEGIAPINYARLAKSGLIKSVSVDHVVDLMGKRRDLAVAAQRLYTEGWLSFASLAELTGARTANVLVRSTASNVATRLRAPIQPDLSEDPYDLTGKTFVCTALELLLLGHCRVLDHVSEALKGGRLLTTQAAWATMLEDGYFLEQSAQRDEATRLRSFIARVSSGRVAKATEEGAERAVATARGCRYVTTTASEPNDVDALGLLGAIALNGGLSRSDLTFAARCLGREATSYVPLTLPDAPLYFETGVLDLFDRAKVLDVVLDELKEEVVVSARDIDLSRARLQDLELTASAAALQRHVIQRLGEARRDGWFDIVPTPPSPPLPSLREDVEEERADLLTHSIRQLLPLKHLVLNQDNWLRLTAESFGFDSIGHADQWRVFAFTPSDGQAYVARYWLRRDREISLSRFVRTVAQGTVRPEAVRTLARLGFTDALLPSDIVELADEFGRLDMGRSGDVLDGAEAAAADHLVHGVSCRMHLGMAYARASWRAATCAEFESLRDVPVQLLSRLERIDSEHSTRLVEQSLSNLFLCALDDRDASFGKATEDTYKLDRSSPAGRLWSVLANWESENTAREAMTRRAVAHAWLVLGDFKNGPTTQAQWAPLGLITDMLMKEAGVSTDVPSPDAVVAVMSANWKEKPLTRRGVTFALGDSRVDRPVEDLLQAAATVIDRDGARGSDGTSITFEFQPASDQPVARVSVPFEAALLRTSPAAASREAISLAIAIGMLDGRLYRALTDFASDPKSDTRRRDLARAACGSPFRWVADDPRFLLRLGDRASASQHDFPSDLDELREMLSEPPGMLTGAPVGVAEMELPQELARRLEDGFWSNRHDKAELVHFASRYPGRLPAEAARALIDDTKPDELRRIVKVLKSSQDRSIGELAIATAFATFAAFGKYANDEPSLRESIVDALSTMLDREARAPAAPCLASIEPAVLARVGEVVGRLSLVPMPTADHAWLTHRLYEWWVRLASFDDLSWSVRDDSPPVWHEVRTELLLNVMLDVLEVQLIARREKPEPIAALAPKLVDLASQRRSNPFEPAPRPPGWLYWRRPQGVGWLASSIALWIDPNSFFSLQPEIRLAGLDRLPRTAVDAEKNGVSFASFVPAMARYMSRLNDPEVEAVREWLKVAEPSVLLDLWRADVLTGFVAAHGDPTDAAQLRALAVLENVAKERTELLVAYMEAVASSKREALHETVFELAETIEAADGWDALDRAVGLALERARGDLVQALLISLDQVAAGSERYRDTPFARAIRAALVGTNPTD